MFCGGTLAEGWSLCVVRRALCVLNLIDEVSFLTPLESYSQQYVRLHASARAIVDENLYRMRCGMFSRSCHAACTPR